MNPILAPRLTGRRLPFSSVILSPSERDRLRRSAPVPGRSERRLSRNGPFFKGSFALRRCCARGRTHSGAVGSLLPWLLVLALFPPDLSARAQSVLAPPPPVSSTPPALQEFRATEAGVLPSSEGLGGIPLGSLPFQWGPVHLRPSAFYSLSYVDGLLNTPGHPESSIINQLSLGMPFTIGSHLTVSYSPSWTWYSNDKFGDSLSHSAGLNWWTAYEDWTLGLSQSYSTSSSTLVETGTQTEQESFGTALTASYRFNSKVSVDLDLNQDVEATVDFQGYRQWSTMDYVNYQFWPRFNAGLGVGAGYVDVDVGPDMVFEQFQGRIAWRATDKSSLTLHGGLEYRQFLSGGQSPMLNPVFGLSFQQRIAKKTTFSLSADRTVGASYFANQTTESASVSANLGQNLYRKLTLSFGGGYGTTSYSASAQGVSDARGYTYTSFTVGLSYPILTRGSLGLSYQHSDNSSSQPGLSFTSNQVGLHLTYAF